MLRSKLINHRALKAIAWKGVSKGGSIATGIGLPPSEDKVVSCRKICCRMITGVSADEGERSW
jgi:hypothetical protein